jgi:anaerobic magnesium-protoporphyrin IX monomethyl ester cyclase
MKNIAKVLLVVPRYGNFGDFYQVPLGLAYIASSIESAGFEVIGLNLNHIKGDVSSLVAEAVADEQPQVLATGGLSVFIDQIKEIIDTAKSTNNEIFTVLGGGVVSGEPDSILKVVNADIGVINEGEETIVEILNSLKIGADLTTIAGVVVRTARGGIKRNAERDQRRDLENIAWANYRILDLDKSIENQRVLDSYFFHLAPDNNPRSLDMISSRSCPFKCTFCFHPTGKTYRERPLDDFFAELEKVKKEFNINMLGIIDELFSLKRTRLLEFCEKIKPFNLKWMVQLHVNSASEETLKAMADSGCVYISYGIESMSQPILDSMMKKSKKTRVEEALALTRKYKIGIQGNLLFGDSAETIDTANESMHWWANNRCYQINLTPLIVFPGSPDYQSALRDGLIEQSERVSYITDIPTNLNISSMNDENMEMVRFMVYVYFESLLRTVQLKKFKSVGVSERGPIYDCTWICSTCNFENEYRNFYIPQDSKNSIRMTCRSCRERFDIENVPYRSANFNKEIPREANIFLERAELAYKMGKFSQAHDFANSALRLCDHFIEARLFLARFYETHGPLEHMLRSYGAAVAFDPYNSDYHLYYAKALSSAGMDGGALLFLDQSLILNPLNEKSKALKLELLNKDPANSTLDKYFRSWSDSLPPQRKTLHGCGVDENQNDNASEVKKSSVKTISLSKLKDLIGL